MKVRWLLVASLFMAMFAVASVSSVSAAPSVVFETKAALQGNNAYPFVHGVADYKVRAGGGSSLAVSIQGAQALRFQKLYVVAETSFDSGVYVNVCTLHIGVNGNGSCVIDTRTGAIVPTFSSGDGIYVSTSPDPNVQTEDVASGHFQ